MLSWLAAAAAGLAVALFQYGWNESGSAVARRRVVPAALRAIAVALVVALLLDAPVGRAHLPPTLVALDVSASWLRAGGDSAWAAARRRALQLSPGPVLLFGDSLRAGTPPLLPSDHATRMRGVVDRALAEGRPLALITDGEAEDAGAAAELPDRSRVEVFARPPARDVAIASLVVPRAAVGGDTVEATVAILSGAGGSAAGNLVVRVGDRRTASVEIDSLGPFAERVLTLALPIPSDEGALMVRAVISAVADREPRNDTLATTIDVSQAATVVFVSTSPDYDARYVLGVLRGALSLPTRGFLRVAAGEWRQDGSLAPVPEAAVRASLRDAPVAIIHGDSSVFGPPRVVTRGALALLSPPDERTGDWYVIGAPPSPLSAALASIPWDSLPPIEVAPALGADPGGVAESNDAWVVIHTARGRRFDRRPAIIGTARPRRVITVGAAGFWRWRFRGGVSADAFTALWGTIFDWLAEERGRIPALVPADGMVRAGEAVRWRRSAGVDSVATIELRRRGAPGGVDSVTLRFERGASVAESEALQPGVYDVRNTDAAETTVSVSEASASVLVVNQSPEWLPRRATLRAGPVRGGKSGVAIAGEAPGSRQRWWLYALPLLLLALEWVCRRRLGLR
ncbi:MAG: hypothetical protein ACRENI_11965 [Gemmatimonadaceae bacterium]